MKSFFLILVTGFMLELPVMSQSCEENFNHYVTIIDNSLYKDGNGKNWTVIKYKNHIVVGHYCNYG